MDEAGWNDELTIEFARELVARADPTELPVLDAMAPELLRRGASVEARRDGTLGFGTELLALASVAVPVAQVVGTFLLGVATSVAADEVSDGIRKRFRRTDAAAPLPAEVVDRAYALALERSRMIGLDESRARLLADAVSGALTTPAKT